MVFIRTKTLLHSFKISMGTQKDFFGIYVDDSGKRPQKISPAPVQCVWKSLVFLWNVFTFSTAGNENRVNSSAVLHSAAIS
jgi:hypothetical protein